MAFDLSSIQSGVNLRPPNLLIHGVEGVGKTTFAAGAPAPVGMLTEDGLGVLDCPHFPLIKSYEDLVTAIGTLANEEHEFNTVFLDSLDHLEPLVWAHVRDLHFDGNQDKFDAYGRGYGLAVDYWRELLSGFNALRNKGMCTILIAHTEIKRYDAPDTEPYDRFQVKLHKGASALVREWADAVLFANWETHISKTEVGFKKEIARGTGTGRRLLHTTEKPAYQAKNRYSLPDTIGLSWAAFDEALQSAITKQSTNKKEAA